MRALKTRWAALARGQRVNLGLYALTALSTVALLFELAAGDNPPRDVDLASRGPTSTLTLRSVPSTTTSSSTTPSTTSTTVPTTSTSAAAPTTRAVPPTTRRTVPPPEPEPTAPPATDPPPTAPPPTEPPITTTQPPATTTTTLSLSQAVLGNQPGSMPSPF